MSAFLIFDGWLVACFINLCEHDTDAFYVSLYFNVSDPPLFQKQREGEGA